MRVLSQKAAIYEPAGVIMLGVLTEGVTPSDIATHDDLDSWIATTKCPFSFALDAVPPQTDMETYFGDPRDTSIIIDLSTMKIVDQITGDVNQTLARLDGLLGIAPPDMATPPDLAPAPADLAMPVDAPVTDDAAAPGDASAPADGGTG